MEKGEFLKEAKLMWNFKHDHILSLIAICLDNDPNFLILELMQGGDLLTYLRSNRPNAVTGNQSIMIYFIFTILIYRRNSNNIKRSCSNVS